MPAATGSQTLRLKRELLDAIRYARRVTFEMVADLSDDQLLGPELPIVNPLRWEIGHLAWFCENWLLRHLRGLRPLIENGDELYNSAEVHHDTRWGLDLPSREGTLSYMQEILNQVEACAAEDGEVIRSAGGHGEIYFLHLALFHEQMHDEAFAYTRHTHGWRAPELSITDGRAGDELRNQEWPRISGDVSISGGTFLLGSEKGGAFTFDNEQWAHEVTVAPFQMSRTAVTNEEFAQFVDDRGYHHREFWSEEGWRWCEDARAEHPVYWQVEMDGGWHRRIYDRVVPLEPRLPVVHVNWHEAVAYCRWAGRRLPTEAEWEFAASTSPGSCEKRLYPWGKEPPTPDRANLDYRNGGLIPVDALHGGDSVWGVRQMIGNVWEWTATDFGPYPGFAPGPYKEYSVPWFGDHKVLRGGTWCTRSRMITNTYRNFYKPCRRDVWCGFRTCAV